jgi:hypothetical protein
LIIFFRYLKVFDGKKIDFNYVIINSAKEAIMLIKRKNVVVFNAALYTLKGKYNASFRCAVRINKAVITPAIREIRAKDKTFVEQFSEYQSKRKGLVDKYATRTPSGELSIEDNQCTISKELHEEFSKNEALLKEQYKDAINMREIEKDKFNEYLETEVDINIFQVRERCFPENIPQEVYEALSPMIQEKPVKGV